MPFTRAVFSVNPPGILEVLSCVTCPLLFLFLLFVDHRIHKADVRARGPRGVAPAGFICVVVLASASRFGGRVAPVVITGRCSGLRSGPRQYSPGIIW